LSYSHRIARALRLQAARVKIVSWRDVDYDLVSHLNPHRDAIFFRCGARSAVGIAQRFEDAGFQVLNDSRYMQLSGQKYLANVYARSFGISTPSLNVSIKKRDKSLMAHYLNAYGPLVAKPIRSRNMGRFVFRVHSERDFADVDTIPGQSVLIQSEVQFDRLVRTIVTRSGVLVDATTYDTKRSGWKVTVCANPDAMHYRDVPAELVFTAERTIRVFDGDVAYIDFFETSDGYVLSEINQCCALQHQERITGYPIADELARFVVSRVGSSFAV
jgi:glutathione synthase/RimK-type ligase-like ATP-grasp enzyme